MIKRLRMDRLCSLYDPQGVMEALELPMGTAWLKATKTIPNHRFRRGPKYHSGRVRYFVERLRSGLELDPIEVCYLPATHSISGFQTMGGYPEFFLGDGHHRFVASLYMGMDTILATYSGREDLLRYLMGKRKTCPKL